MLLDAKDREQNEIEPVDVAAGAESSKRVSEMVLKPEDVAAYDYDAPPTYTVTEVNPSQPATSHEPLTAPQPQSPNGITETTEAQSTSPRKSDKPSASSDEYDCLTRC